MSESKTKTERKPTTRVVLQEVKVPAGTLPDDVRPSLDVDADGNVSLYIEIGTAQGSAVKATESAVGERAGSFRAPPVSSWRTRVEQGEEVIPEQRKIYRRRVIG